ncbi:MAG: hypothetical protein JW943_04090 [Deltaproteobacteria bacterium]|nr:hypothetical protein [Deltaproteobacteria bacterium]
MIDPKKAEEISRKIRDIAQQISNHKNNFERIKKDKEYKVRDFDRQMEQENEAMKRLGRQIDDLKRQI